VIELAVQTNALEQAPRETSALWTAVDRIVDSSPTLADLYSHQLELLAARRWRELGRPVPELLAAEGRLNLLVSLAARPLLERTRASYDGPLLLMKGPEVAALYPDPGTRSYRDLDLLVPDARQAQAALLAAGFEETGDPRLYEGIHHLRPLRWKSLPLMLEIHEQPKWVDWGDPPATEELLAVGVPSATRVEGVLTLPPAHHALVLAVHSWAHEPLRRLRDLIDLAALLEPVDRAEAGALACRYDVERIWRTTVMAVDATLGAERSPASMRVWARNLRSARDRTVLESHLSRWLACCWALPPRRAARQMIRALARDARPEPGERWGTKARRTGWALRGSLTRRTEHEESLGPLLGPRE
jgi:Uncharacterised nucleotidyltransferase